MLEVRREEADRVSRQRWSVPLTEEVFETFVSRGGKPGNPGNPGNVFGEGSLFSPLLFGKFFDPSDAFPLWDFESEILLAGIRSAGKSSVDWFENETDHVLKAELQGLKKFDLQITVNGKVLEISGQWRKPESDADWRCGNWWEFGFVRRLELPENSNSKKIEANIVDDFHLEIKIPKNSDPSFPQVNSITPKDSGFE